MKKDELISPSPPRRDSWLAKLSEEARIDVLRLRRRMNWQDALKYIKEKYDVTVSRTSYFATTKRYSTNEIAAAQLKAASKPPALDYLVRITEAVERIDKSLKTLLSKVGKSESRGE